MSRVLRRSLIVVTTGALLAGASAAVGAQAVDEGGRSATAPTTVAPEDSPPLVSGASTAVAPVAPAHAAGGEAKPGGDGSLTVGLSNGDGDDGDDGDGDEGDGESSPTAGQVDGVELDDAEIRAVLNRLPPWDGDAGGETDFNRPVESLRPPRTGKTIDQPFPAGPDVPAPDVSPGPLEILRVQPQGEVGISPFVSITFNQPMVPLAMIDQLDNIDIPVEMTPQLPGRWQWIGTRTLRFDHDQEILDRLPMATSYVLEVPKGTRSQAGGELPETFRSEFETTPPSVERLTPQGISLELQPVFLVTFDQRIEPAAVIEAVTLLVNDEAREIRLASAAEIEGDERIRSYVESALEDTWIAFRPAVPLSRDSYLRITVGPHVPSAEGPNTSEQSWTFTARTYAPLQIEYTTCLARWPCGPGTGLETSFNNPLDAETVDAADFSIAPEIPDARIAVSGRRIGIYGSTAANTVYKVVVPGTVGDVFGQRLGEAETVEFVVGEARPRPPGIWQLGGDLVTVDPLGATQTIPVAVRRWEQLRVRLYAVDPSDYRSYLDFRNLFASHFSSRYRREPAELKVPWSLVTEEIVATGIDDDEPAEIAIDLSGALDGGHGHLVVIVEGVVADRTAGETGAASEPQHRSGVIAWVQDTDIGVDVITDYGDAAVWTTDLRSGDPLAGVEIQLGGQDPALVSDDNGIARTSLNGGSIPWIVASLGEDSALAPTSVQARLVDQTIWYTTDDRGLYRPGETLHLKGWIRRLDVTGSGDLEFLPSGQRITYRVYDPLGNDLGSGEVRTDDHGGFDLTVDLAAGANLGRSRIVFQRPDEPNSGHYVHRFRVQEFRRPEFEVEARLESDGPHLIDEPAIVAVDARYFSGGPLSNAEVSWRVTTWRGSYSPPNWRRFTFGVWQPWWYSSYSGASYNSQEFSGVTDATGSHHLRIDTEDDGDHLPKTVTARARVVDVNRQRWASTTGYLVHAADLYVGLRSERYFMRVGDAIEIQAVVTDIDGNPVAGRALEVTKERLVYERVDGEWVEVVLDPETCAVTSGRTPVDCEFASDTPGRYRIGTYVVDDSGRTNRTEITRWIAGEKTRASSRPPNRRVVLESVSLIPDVETYAAGDIAEILVDSPFASASGILTIAHTKMVEVRRFEVTDHVAVLEVPITDAHVPQLRLRVDLASTTERTADDGTPVEGAPPRPAHASGQILLRVPPVQRELNVTATPESAVVQPGAATSIVVEVTDAGGVPVEGANVLLYAVDEAVLALSSYDLTDPIGVFYRPRTARLDATRSRSMILLDRPIPPEDLRDLIEAEEYRLDESMVAMADDAAPAADAGGSTEAALQVAVRENLDALALFEPLAVTGATGRATVEFELPDNLTRYRVMAVVVDGTNRFGVAESAITARLPLQVRPSAPRFLNFGDSFELLIVVQNRTDSATEVDVVVQTSNLEIVGSAGRRIVVPANDRVEVGFPARAVAPGVARFRAVAVSAAHSDAQLVSLPVYTPATSEAFATYGVVDEGADIQPVIAPQGVFPQFGGLEINTSSTALQALTDAVLYLATYRYASSDAYASRIMAISALRDVLAAFDAEGLASPGELDATVRHDIGMLSSLQNSDGGFGWWSRYRGSSPYASIQAMHALVIARDNGFEVPARMMNDGRWYLRNIERRIPDHYSRRSKDMLLAYTLHVRSLDGQHVANDARDLWHRRGEALGLDALAWLWPVVDDDAIEAEIERLLNNRAVETAGAATFATDYGEDAYLLLHSDRRTDAIVLDALITMAPQSDLIPKVVTGLLAHRVRGRWNNVQENSFILLALERYFDTFEATDPDFVARVWLGDLYAAEHEYSGRSTDRGSTLIPMAELLDAGDSDLIVQKDGDGRLYYRLGLRYAPDDLDLDPLDRGFAVQRSYEAIDDPGDVWLDDDGVWHVRAGATVRVNVTMFNESRRTNMALVDPLPAGFEPLNPALAVTGDIDVRSGSGWWWWTWFRHQNLRDDRAEAFASYLRTGTHEYSYVVRATTTGSFVVPPAKAEEIYAPEVFGRSGSDRVIVENTR